MPTDFKASSSAPSSNDGVFCRAARCRLGVSLAAFLFAVACAPGEPIEEPQILRLSTDEVVVGETLYFVGKGLPTPDEAEILLEFSGAYIWQDEEGRHIAEDVPSYSVLPVFEGFFPEGGKLGAKPLAAEETVLRWNRFGPFEIPFGSLGNRQGVFRGTVRPIMMYRNGDATEGKPLEVAIEVKPSVLVKRFEPVVGRTDDNQIITPDCGGPALRVFGGVPYVLEVEAIGIEPAYFIYEISNINGSENIQTFTHTARGKLDSLGDPDFQPGEIVVFNGVDDDVEFSLASIRITVVDANNNIIETAMPVPVIRPVSFYYDGSRQLAEYYEPVPVHGPIVGGIGTTITYAESQSEARQNAVSVTFGRSVTESLDQTQIENWSEGYSSSTFNETTTSSSRQDSEAENSSESYGVDYSSSEASSMSVTSESGTDWNYSVNEGQSSEDLEETTEGLYGEASASVSVEGGGGVSIPGIANATGKVGSTVGGTVGRESGKITGTVVGQSKEEGMSMGGSESEGTAFGSVTTDSTSESVSGSYGVERQSSINSGRSETNASEESVTYDMGGASSVTEGYSVGSTESWSETWVNTSTQSNLLSFSGKIPNGRCAVIYRQTVRYVRTAKLYQHDLCGVREKMANLVFNEWSWSPNIAIGDDCQTSLPPSTQPPAECFYACE